MRARLMKAKGTWYRIPENARMILYILLSPIFSALLAVTVGELTINALYFGKTELPFASALAFGGNVLILSCTFLILIAAVNRIFLAIILGSSLYGLLIVANILKLRSFDNPVRPTDIQYLPDLKVIARPSLSAGSVCAAIAIAVAVLLIALFLWKSEKRVFALFPRIGTLMFASAVLVSIFIVPAHSRPRDWLNEQGIELPEWWQFEPRESAKLNGLLVEWAMMTREFSFRAPDRYSDSEIRRIVRSCGNSGELPASERKTEPLPNVIVLLVESFMDPRDLGVRFTSDPIPTFRKLSSKWSSGKVVVPVFGGTSANTEFEVLTGMSMSLMPEASCPYKQYINEDIPSLPRLLHQYGYRTEAVFADPSYLFSRKKVLGHLGFDRWDFPEGYQNTPRTPDNNFAADEVIADAAIHASSGRSPFFFLGFTGGTHCPWEYPDYSNSSLDIVGPMSRSNRARLKTYINALLVADNALKKLVEHYSKIDQKTIILIMGDHLPPLAGIYDETHYFKADEMEQARQRYSVPAVFWTNFPAVKKDFVRSANFIPAMLLQQLNLQPEGIFALSAEMAAYFPVFSKYLQTVDGRIYEPESPEIPYRRLIENFRTIEYDLLVGKQFVLDLPGWREREPRIIQ